MNTKQIINALALAGMGFATLANAEPYDGVLAIRSERPRSELVMEARGAALRPIFGEASLVDAAPGFVGRLTRAEVRRDAVSASRAGNLHGDHAGAGVLSLRGGSPARELSGMPRSPAPGG